MIEEGESELADAEIPVRMSRPGYIQIIVPAKGEIDLSALDLVDDCAVVDPVDRHEPAITLVVQLAPDFFDIADIDDLNAEQLLHHQKVATGLLVPRVDFHQHYILACLVGDDSTVQKIHDLAASVIAVVGGKIARQRPVLLCQLGICYLESHQRGEALHLDQLREKRSVRSFGNREVDGHEERPLGLVGNRVLGAQRQVRALEICRIMRLHGQLDRRLLALLLHLPGNETGGLAHPKRYGCTAAIVEPFEKGAIPLLGKPAVELFA